MFRRTFFSAFVILSCRPTSDSVERATKQKRVPIEESAVCATQSVGLNGDGDEVVFCDEAFPDRPFVRPPADDLTTDSVVFYAGLQALGGPTQALPVFTLRDGRDVVILDKDEQVPSGWPGLRFVGEVIPESRMPSHRSLYTVYEVRGKLQTVTVAGQDVLGVSAVTLRPAIVIKGMVLDGSSGVYEGEVAPNTGDFAAAYDWSRAKRFRFVVDTVAPETAVFSGLIPEWIPEGAALPDGEIFQMEGNMVNANEPVTASDGSCLQPLTAGDFNPLAAVSDGRFTLLRFPGMHTPEDEVITMFPTNEKTDGDYPEGMGPMSVLHAAGFLQAQAAETLLHPHGFPGNFALRIRPVIDVASEAGQPCTSNAPDLAFEIDLKR